MPTSQKRTKLVAACALSLTLILPGCATIGSALGGTTEPLPVNDVACRAFQRIEPSRRDTDETLKQIHEHNAVFLELCGAARD